MKIYRYTSGEEVRDGDHIRYNGEPGEVRFVIFDKTGDSAADWYVERFGGGLMIEARSFGSVFLAEGDIDEDLEFTSRATP
jgi:hypothetical protein